MLSVIGLIAALVLLIWLTVRGANPLVAAPACALLVALSGGLALLPQAGVDTNYIQSYMAGFTKFVASWFFMFLLGSIFGKLMEHSGAADSVAHWIVGHFGARNAPIAVVLACAILTYGGVSVFIVAFSVYPVALGLFRDANLPRRFIPAALAFGSATFTMTSAGSPEIQNWIPIEFLHTSPWAGWPVSIPVAFAMAGLGFYLMQRMMGRAVANGEGFIVRADDPDPEPQRNLPPVLGALLPLLAVLVVSFFYHEKYSQYALVLALLAGCIVVWGLNWQSMRNPGEALSAGSMGALIAIGNTAAVVGFGAVAKASPAFDIAVQAITSMPGDGLISASIAVTVICALTGSASGGQAIAIPAVAPHYLELGVQPDELHRMIALSSGGLDSLPHNGYVVTTIRAICGEEYRGAYPAVGVLTVIVPIVGMALALTLFAIF